MTHAGTQAARGDVAVVARALAGLLPPSVASASAPVDDRVGRVHPDEEAVVATAGAQRRREFRAGRACAREALHRLGVDPRPVRREPSREPRWPPGVVGSITHTRSVAVAAVARDCDAWGLGVDLEPLDPPVDPAVDRLVRTADERRAGDRDPQVARAVFCAKECVFKALFPATRWPLGFHDVTVSVDLPGERFRAVVDDRFRLDGRPLRPLAGRLTVVDGYLLAGLSVPPGGPTG